MNRSIGKTAAAFAIALASALALACGEGDDTADLPPFGEPAAASGEESWVIEGATTSSLVEPVESWSLEAILYAGPAPDTAWGVVVAIDGGLAAVTGKDAASNGVVHLFGQTAEGRWQKAATLSSHSPEFGASLALDEATLIVGSPREAAAYVFAPTRGHWVEQARLSLAGRARFGASVALDGSTLAVGDPAREPNGAAHVFVRQRAGWMFQATLVAPGDVQLGEVVSVSGDVVVAGAQHAAHVFERDGGKWLQTAQLDADAYGDRWAASVSGTAIVVGAPPLIGGGPTPSGDGAAYLYRKLSRAWSLEAVLTVPATSDNLGCAVDIERDVVLVQSCGTFGLAPFVAVFERDRAGWEHTAILEARSGAHGPQLSSSAEHAIVAGGWAGKGAGFVFAR